MVSLAQLLHENESMTDQENGSSGATLLVVEDDLALLRALQDILEAAGFQVRTATHGEEALESFRQKKPDMILSDISMPVMDGLQLFEAVRRQSGGMAIPFIILSAHSNGRREDKFHGRSLGVDDYITKPISSHELLTTVRACLRRTDELMVEQIKIAYKDSLLAFANAIELRDPYTYNHVKRIDDYAQAMAKELGWEEARREVLEFGAILHDIGKLNVLTAILSKKEGLTPEEWEVMRRHPQVGARMIGKITYLAPVVPMILHHHEQWDGSGYPDGLVGEEIPEEARLLAVIDSFDAMTFDRPYRSAIPPELALEEIKRGAGVQFDPKMVEIFQRIWESSVVKSIMRDQVESGDEIEGIEIGVQYSPLKND
jgi:putative two-component system response regulator